MIVFHNANFVKVRKGIVPNGSQVYLVADLEAQNFKLR